VTMVAWQASPVQPQSNLTAGSPYEKWLNEDVVYIISDRERAAFRKLVSDYERANFIKAFWELRNPHPGAADNAAKEEHYRRISYANERYHTTDTPGWKTDRGHIYVAYGPPEEIESHPSPREHAPYEEWRYRHLEGIGNDVIVKFVDQTGRGDYRMTTDPAGKN